MPQAWARCMPKDYKDISDRPSLTEWTFRQMAALVNICSGINTEIQRLPITKHGACGQVTLRRARTKTWHPEHTFVLGNSVTVSGEEKHGWSWTLATCILLNKAPPFTVIRMQGDRLWVHSVGLTHAAVFNNPWKQNSKQEEKWLLFCVKNQQTRCDTGMYLDCTHMPSGFFLLFFWGGA